MNDPVNHPAHYKSPGGLEAIQVIESFELGYHLGNAAKYILRAGKKDSEMQDLQKAVWYLMRHLKALEAEHGREMDTEGDKEAWRSQEIPRCAKGQDNTCC